MKPRCDHGARHDRLLLERIHDPYKASRRLPEPTGCPECGAVFHGGRWQWITPPPTEAHRTPCHAFHRFRDQYPAGTIRLRGEFVRRHSAELLNLVRHPEEDEKRDHPLHRIMKIEEQPAALTITTTDIHLPPRIAAAVPNAYEGNLMIHHDEEGYLVRVDWER